MKRVHARNVPVLMAAVAAVVAAAAVENRSRIIAANSGLLCRGSRLLPEGRDAKSIPYSRAVKISIMIDSEKAIELEGTIMSVLPGTMFRVALANDHLVLAHI